MKIQFINNSTLTLKIFVIIYTHQLTFSAYLILKRNIHSINLLLPSSFKLVLGKTWFGSEVRLVFWGSVGSRFGFWGQKRGSVGSRFGFDRKTSKNHQFFLILFSKVWGSVWFLGGLVGSRFGFQEQIGGSVGSRVDFWRFKMFDPILQHYTFI